MKRLLWLLMCIFLPALSLAANEYAVSKRVVGSMVVTGSIVVNPDGSVSSYTLDQPDKLPSAVVEVIGKAVPSWKFQPILMLDSHNKPERAKAAMSLRVVASPLSDGNYGVTINGVSFGRKDAQSAEDISWNHGGAPLGVIREWTRHPLSGTAYLMVKVDRSGHVADVGVQQVDLRAVASDSQMDAWRRELGRWTTTAAPTWTFKFPQVGKAAASAYLFVRVPVDFNPDGRPIAYGQWDAYVPGPVNQIPWAGSDNANSAADAIPDNGIAFQDDTRFVLLTPPSPG